MAIERGDNIYGKENFNRVFPIPSLHLIFLVTLTFIQFNSSAQALVNIRGKVVDDTSLPVEFANVYLTSKLDSVKIISGTTTDSTGVFSIPEVPVGEYLLNVQFIGFTKIVQPIKLQSSNGNFILPDITLKPDAQLLNGVEVTAFRSMITKTDEGIVVNASENLTQIGGSAADLLKNMPGVLVGSEGEVTLRGKSPLIMINSRISGVAGIGSGTNLAQIPASSIERIEIINNPSSKYSADAEGGIINIILKKSTGTGTNGAFALGGGHGSRARWTGSGLLNYGSPKFNVGLSYDNWLTTRTRKISRYREQYTIPDEYYLTQDRHDANTFQTQTARFNAAYNPNDKNSLNFEAIWLYTGEDNGEDLVSTTENDQHNFNFRNNRYSNEIRRFNTVETLLSYTRKFDKPDQQLSINASSTFEIDREHTDINTKPLDINYNESGTTFFQRTKFNENSHLYNVSVDYTQPVADHGMFETGYRAIIRGISVDFLRASEQNGELVTDVTNSDTFNFNDQIHAAYAQYNGWTGDKEDPTWKYSMGLRVEKVWNHGSTVVNPTDFKYQYFNLFPSASVIHYGKKHDSYKFTYSRRINRPDLDSYNPFIDITDSLNQHSGNPYLRPELAHSLELGYYHAKGPLTISMSAFYRHTRRIIMSYVTLFDNGVALSKPMNFGSSSTYGFESIVTYQPVKFWNVNFNISGYQLQIDDSNPELNIQRKQFTLFSKMINNFTLWKSARLQITGNYTSPIAVPQGSRIAIKFVDIGLQQQLFKGQGRLALTVLDVFNVQKSGTTLSDVTFNFRTTSKLDTRAFMLIFGYTIKSDFRERLLENRFKN